MNLPAMGPYVHIHKRQNVFSIDVDEDNWWGSTKGYTTKWTLFGVLFVLVLAWLVGGYFHAKSRLRKGRRLMAYHRFLVPRYERDRFEMENPTQPNPYHGWFPQPPANGYAMQPVQEQLPAYNAEVPPTYQPPQGNSKENGYVPSPPPPSPPPPPNDTTTTDQTTGTVSSNTTPTPPTNSASTPPPTSTPATEGTIETSTNPPLPVLPVLPDLPAFPAHTHPRS